jgi:hypothetical protein
MKIILSILFCIYFGHFSFAQSSDTTDKSNSIQCWRTGKPVTFIDGIRFERIDKYRSGNTKTLVRLNRSKTKVKELVILKDQDNYEILKSEKFKPWVDIESLFPNHTFEE